jgi:hypothetical protein
MVSSPRKPMRIGSGSLQLDSTKKQIAKAMKIIERRM